MDISSDIVIQGSKYFKNEITISPLFQTNPTTTFPTLMAPKKLTLPLPPKANWSQVRSQLTGGRMNLMREFRVTGHN